MADDYFMSKQQHNESLQAQPARTQRPRADRDAVSAAMSAAATDTREQREQREQRQKLLQSGLDLIDQGFTVFDAELRLVAWNHAFMRLLDFPDHLAFEA